MKPVDKSTHFTIFSWFLANLVASHAVPASSTQSTSREGSVQKETTPMDVYEQQQVSEDVVPDLADAMAELEMSETDTKCPQDHSPNGLTND